MNNHKSLGHCGDCREKLYAGTHLSAVSDRSTPVLRRFGPGVDVLHQAAHHFAVGNCR